MTVPTTVALRLAAVGCDTTCVAGKLATATVRPPSLGSTSTGFGVVTVTVLLTATVRPPSLGSMLHGLVPWYT